MILQKAKVEKELWEKKVELICWVVIIMAALYFTPVIIKIFCR